MLLIHHDYVPLELLWKRVLKKVSISENYEAGR